MLSRNFTGRSATFEALRSVGKGYATKVRPVAPLALQNSLRYPHALSNYGRGLTDTGIGVAMNRIRFRSRTDGSMVSSL